MPGTRVGCAIWPSEGISHIQLPGLVTADLKDVWVTIGVAALCAEALDNPKLSWRWGSWRNERDDLIQLLRDLYGFSIQELRRIREEVRSRLGKGKRSGG